MKVVEMWMVKKVFGCRGCSVDQGYNLLIE